MIRREISHFKNRQKTWTVISTKKMHEWPINIRRVNQLLGKYELKITSYPQGWLLKKKVLERIQRNKNLQTKPLQKSLALSLKIKHKCTLQLVFLVSITYPWEMETCIHTKTTMNVYRSIMHNCQRWKIFRWSTGEWINKMCCVCIYWHSILQ